MQQLIPRDELLEEVWIRLVESLVTALLGARQVGKTTLASMVTERVDDVTFFDLEREQNRAALA